MYASLCNYPLLLHEAVHQRRCYAILAWVTDIGAFHAECGTGHGSRSAPLENEATCYHISLCLYPFFSSDVVRVKATVTEHTKTAKVIVFKKKRRKNYKRTKGKNFHLVCVEYEALDHISRSCMYMHSCNGTCVHIRFSTYFTDFQVPEGLH